MILNLNIIQILMSIESNIESYPDNKTSDIGSPESVGIPEPLPPVDMNSREYESTLNIEQPIINNWKENIKVNNESNIVELYFPDNKESQNVQLTEDQTKLLEANLDPLNPENYIDIPSEKNKLDKKTSESKYFPPLSNDGERVMLIRAKAGDPDAIERLILSNMGMVVKHAYSYCRKNGELNLFPDAIQEGALSIYKSIHGYNMENKNQDGNPYRFMTYATKGIYTSFYSLFRNEIDAGMKNKYFSEKNKDNNVETANPKDFIEQIKYDDPEVQEIVDPSKSVEDQIIDMENNRELQEIINDAITKSSGRHKDSVLKYYPDLDPNVYGGEESKSNSDKRPTFKEIGEEAGITGSRIQLITQNILRNIRKGVQNKANNRRDFEENFPTIDKPYNSR